MTTVRGGAAQERLSRLFARFLAVGYLIDFAMTLPSVLAAARASPTLTVVTVAAVFGSGVLLGVVSFAERPLPLINTVCALAAASYLGAVALWLLSGVRVEGQHFLAFLPALPAMAISMPLRARYAAAYSGVAVLGGVLVNRTSDNVDPLFPALIFGTAFLGIFVSAAMVAWRVGERLDTAQAAASDAAAATAVARARASEQRRFAAFVHDDVLATLIGATRGDVADALPRNASSALRALDRGTYVAAVDDSRLVTGTDVVNEVAAVAARTLPRADVVGSACADARLPNEVLRALSAAAGEALRNVNRHAGECDTTITVRVDKARAEVEIRDTGVGFVPGAVPDNRIGISHSIVARMSEVGGQALADSTPGGGTRISLIWSSL